MSCHSPSCFGTCDRCSDHYYEGPFLEDRYIFGPQGMARSFEIYVPPEYRVAPMTNQLFQHRTTHNIFLVQSDLTQGGTVMARRLNMVDDCWEPPKSVILANLQIVMPTRTWDPKTSRAFPLPAWPKPPPPTLAQRLEALGFSGATTLEELVVRLETGL